MATQWGGIARMPAESTSLHRVRASGYPQTRLQPQCVLRSQTNPSSISHSSRSHRDSPSTCTLCRALQESFLGCSAQPMQSSWHGCGLEMGKAVHCIEIFL